MKCPLCTGIYDSIDKFCGVCYKRAEEDIDRRMGSITEHEQAALVALSYLGFLYEGEKPLMVTHEAELVCLAVTVAADVRRYRAKIADLEAELQLLRHPVPTCRDLANLIKG